MSRSRDRRRRADQRGGEFGVKVGPRMPVSVDRLYLGASLRHWVFMGEHLPEAEFMVGLETP